MSFTILQTTETKSSLLFDEVFGLSATQLYQRRARECLYFGSDLEVLALSVVPMADRAGSVKHRGIVQSFPVVDTLVSFFLSSVVMWQFLHLTGHAVVSSLPFPFLSRI